MKKLRILAFALDIVLILALFAALPLTVFAEGVSFASVGEEDNPLVVEKAVITYDLNEFPDFESAADYLAYTGNVTMEYHLYNPSNSAVTATLFLPLGREPYEQFYAESGGKKNGVDAEKYFVEVNGERITPELRHSGRSSFGSWKEGDRVIYSVEDEYAAYYFYYPEAPVTVCTYTVSGIVGEDVLAAMEIPPEGIQNRNAQVYIPGQYSSTKGDDGIVRDSIEVKNGDSFNVYIIGSESPELPPWYIYSKDGIKTGERIGGSVTFTQSEHITFRELALTKWTPESGISQVDWYNAFALQFQRIQDYYNMDLDLSDELYRFYKYEITLEAGERLVNTVSMPIYPKGNSKYSPPIYTYNLDFNSGWKPAENAVAEVYINTPYYMNRQEFGWLAVNYITDSYPGEYERTENGYFARFEEFPYELIFTLSESEEPKRESNVGKAIIVLLLLGALGQIASWIGIIATVVVVTVLIVKAVKKIRMKRNNSDQ